MWGNNVDLDRNYGRLKFIIEMAEILEKNKTVIWIDETTCNLWANKGKIWQSLRNPMHIKLPERGKSITVFGGLFSNTGKFEYMIGDTTNKEDFLLFLEDHIYPLIDDVNNTVLCFDNHASHYAIIVK